LLLLLLLLPLPLLLRLLGLLLLLLLFCQVLPLPLLLKVSQPGPEAHPLLGVCQHDLDAVAPAGRTEKVQEGGLRV
jgi:hypothetical protein